MSKQTKKQKMIDSEQTQDVESMASDMIVEEPDVNSADDIKEALDKSVDASKKRVDLNEAQPIEPEKKQKSGGKAIAILALLVALGVGGVGYYCVSQKYSEVQQQIQALQQSVGQVKESVSATTNSSSSADTVLRSLESEQAKISKLSGDYQKALDKIAQLERTQDTYSQQITGLQSQLEKVVSLPEKSKSLVLLSDADFLLNNALRKMVLDNDIETTKNLLVEADNVLSQTTDPKVFTIREAIKTDLNQLSNINSVDQNSIMQRLGQLANMLDDMPMLDTTDPNLVDNGDVSDSIEDWEKNLEKSANSFLNRFIRVSDKNKATDKVFIAPNQEIYLRENIRLRLQIALLAVPRQQNDLYKRSLGMVSTWVRSYFDVNNTTVKSFLNELESLMDQSIYIDAPSTLRSLTLLDKTLDKDSSSIEKVNLEVDKELDGGSEVQEQQKNDSSSATEQPVNEESAQEEK
ncbi:uroporphyrinogen-III C-methyltransferase [Otariodibacter oris]|uniref:Uroporphyrin-3 C-methyltransferase n=1 Tax=Otariodibacter oris TaxID=1032623 RepID=A0A420XIR8_9PAST|nr:uroporphyrinogen-III C-methyltransferase [Otariodibacter oris]QGM80630.1 HemX protein [Otariodibacter oris]RKR77212.1 uroporphyrin-3 C-methyltransferase [Otariodibacter oris]